MTRQEIKEQLNKIFIEVFDDDSIEISDSTTAMDIDDWDSLSHITLISTIEEKFGVEFKFDEITSLKNVGEFISCIESKL